MLCQPPPWEGSGFAAGKTFPIKAWESLWRTWDMRGLTETAVTWRGLGGALRGECFLSLEAVSVLTALFLTAWSVPVPKVSESARGGKLAWRPMCRVPVEKVTAGELMKSRHRVLGAAQPRKSAQSRVFSAIQ